VREVGRWLGRGIGNLINLFNPDLVVLGGLYQRLFPHLEDAVVEGANLQSLDAPRDVVTIARSGLGQDAPLIGAGELVLSGVIGDPANGRRADGRALAGRAGP
jgi:predicted NBD/HSP70 family sugar kinase